MQIQTSQNVSLDYDVASIGDRILANLVDYAVYLGWAIFVMVLISALGGLETANSTFIIIGFVYLPIVFYPLLTEYFLNGQTLGKRALNIKVVRLDGSKPTLGGYVIRWILMIADILFYYFVAIVTIAINGKGQRVGDIAAGTAVVKTKRKISFDQITQQKFPDNYKLSFPEVSQLSDRDIETIRLIIKKNNLELADTTAEKISELLSVNYSTNSLTFLKTIVNDYTFVALQTDGDLKS
jgi:uncharacterized RDD family membrane protein YckC